MIGGRYEDELFTRRFGAPPSSSLGYGAVARANAGGVGGAEQGELGGFEAGHDAGRRKKFVLLLIILNIVSEI